MLIVTALYVIVSVIAVLVSIDYIRIKKEYRQLYNAVMTNLPVPRSAPMVCNLAAAHRQDSQTIDAQEARLGL